MLADYRLVFFFQAAQVHSVCSRSSPGACADRCVDCKFASSNGDANQKQTGQVGARDQQNEASTIFADEGIVHPFKSVGEFWVQLACEWQRDHGQRPRIPWMCQGQYLAHGQDDTLDWHRKEITVTLRKSNTDQEGMGRQIEILLGVNDETCSALALQDSSSSAIEPCISHSGENNSQNA